MRKDIEIKLNSKTSKVILPKEVIGVNGENLQGNIIFIFEDNFVNGTAKLDVLINGEKDYIMAIKKDNSYIVPIKSSLLKSSYIDMQLVITESGEDIPIFKSNPFQFKVIDSINAEAEMPEEYPQWIEVANSKLADLDNVIEEVQTKLDNGEFKGDKGDPGEKGDTGEKGQDATINGLNSVIIKAGENVSFNQEENVFTIGAVQPDVSNFITKAVEDLINYYKKSEVYSKEEVDSRISAIPKFKTQVVEVLPQTGGEATLYLLKTGEENNNLYTEYIYVENRWEELGKQELDLTGYAKEEWVLGKIADFLTEKEINDLISNYSYSKNEVDNKLSNKLDNGSLNGYALKTELPTKASELENDAGYVKDTDVVITNKELLSNKSQTIDDSTTKYPSNKAVKDYIDSLDGNEVVY